MNTALIRNNKEQIKVILILALPVILEMALNTLLGLMDTIMISWYIGKEGLSASGYANQIFFTLIFVFSSFNAGATAMISRSYGEKNYNRLREITGQNLSLNFFLGIIIFIFSIYSADYILKIYEISDNVYNLGTSYFKIVSWSIPFLFISLASSASLRGAGDTKTPMIITGTANIINILGNYFLITGFSIFPELGIDGAALSTTISRLIAALAYLFILLHSKKEIRLIISYLKISRYILKPLWNFSYAAALEQLSMQMAFFLNGVIISKLDTTSEAAFRILVNIESTSFMPAIGISIATTTLVGKYLGENTPKKSLHTGYLAAVMGTIWGIIIGTIFLIFPTPILRIFSSDISVINASLLTMKIAGINQAPLAFMIILAGALRGTGDTKGIMFITSARLWLVFIPLSYLFVLIFNNGVAGVWIAESCSFLIFSIIISKRFNKMRWAEIKMFEN
jgi:putative MATE family efflux protein